MRGKFGEAQACGSRDMREDKHTDLQTDTLVAMLRSPSGGEVITTRHFPPTNTCLPLSIRDIFPVAGA